uniref:Uncharacterized protein n=1 Tax=Chromera velia CCMP2878 TaxID=1169474 RepID=A0A0G4F751_9ALVE|eukprot:Cvel_15568.t1-p1 / transcript=Cvel_15568.t1 / gene=Cvel_15568 / organism=Chromera_velia_CCMP2878 / gene_product=hypothetical protein / transcript_product=hypothetical protein / location=Cvel_scaffold1157:37415-41508(-) / protein_length=541 / sequence_SO=supercontig / SO=protein_coding / is_pseudo=false
MVSSKLLKVLLCISSLSSQLCLFCAAFQGQKPLLKRSGRLPGRDRSRYPATVCEKKKSFFQNLAGFDPFERLFEEPIRDETKKLTAEQIAELQENVAWENPNTTPERAEIQAYLRKRYNELKASERDGGEDSHLLFSPALAGRTTLSGDIPPVFPSPFVEGGRGRTQRRLGGRDRRMERWKVFPKGGSVVLWMSAGGQEEVRGEGRGGGEEEETSTVNMFELAAAAEAEKKKQADAGKTIDDLEQEENEEQLLGPYLASLEASGQRLEGLETGRENRTGAEGSAQTEEGGESLLSGYLGGDSSSSSSSDDLLSGYTPIQSSVPKTEETGKGEGESPSALSSIREKFSQRMSDSDSTQIITEEPEDPLEADKTIRGWLKRQIYKTGMVETLRTTGEVDGVQIGDQPGMIPRAVAYRLWVNPFGNFEEAKKKYEETGEFEEIYKEDEDEDNDPKSYVNLPFLEQIKYELTTGLRYPTKEEFALDLLLVGLATVYIVAICFIGDFTTMYLTKLQGLVRLVGKALKQEMATGKIQGAQFVPGITQ